MKKPFIYLLFIIAIGLLIISQALFTVDQREQAIVLQLGQPVGDIRDPGLHMKLPFVQDVRYFDRRILSVDPDPEQVVISSETLTKSFETKDLKPGQQSEPEEEKAENKLGAPKIDNVSGEPIIVDTFARYQITDPLQFLKTLSSISQANPRLQSIITDATRAVLGQTTLEQLLSPLRTNVMNEIRRRVNRKVHTDKLGIEIVDVRIVRADLTSELRTSTVRRMISELKERATETRAKGEERALEIRSTADKERVVLLAEAEKESQILKGKGDEKAIKIYAKAFNKDKEFYAFMRSMEAYSKTLADPETQLILSPDSKFFRYFKDKNSN